MNTPFTNEQFFSVFEKYNHTLLPVQFILFIFCIFAFIAIGTKIPQKDKIISGILGFLWLWVGIVYHISYFSGVSWIALGFGMLFILEGLFFLWEGSLKHNLKFVFKKSVQTYLGCFFVLYALIVYPFVGYMIEQNFSRLVSVGFPGPTIILTFGFLLLTDKKVPRYLLIIPTIWAVVGISTVIKLAGYQDFMMIIAAIIADVWLLKRKVPVDQQPDPRV
jgi:hypothetical protein